MRMMLIIVLSPRLDFAFGILQRQKTMDVETLRSESAVEGFDRRVVGRLPPTTELENDLVRVCPEVHRGAHELASVVTVDALWQTAVEAQPLECGCDVAARECSADGTLHRAQADDAPLLAEQHMDDHSNALGDAGVERL